MEKQDMKKLVVYYSLEGNCDFIGQTIAKTIGADVLVLEPISKLNPNSFMKYVKGGFQAMFGIKPKLEAFDIQPETYDLIILGTPVWAGRFAPPIKTFLSQVVLKGKTIGLYCCYAGNEGKTFNALKKELAGNDVIGEKSFQDPNKNNQEHHKAEAEKWIEALLLKAK